MRKSVNIMENFYGYYGICGYYCLYEPNILIGINYSPLISILLRITPASILFYLYNCLLGLLLLGFIITAFALSMMTIVKESEFVEIKKKINKT